MNRSLCGTCGLELDPAEGRVVVHLVRDPHGSNRHTCAGTHTVPWRVFASPGPDVETVVRHLQDDSTTDALVAFFDVREMAFHARVVARLNAQGGAEVFMLSPIGAQSAPVGQRVGCVRLYPAASWQWRPVDLRTGEPRLWRDLPGEWTFDEARARAQAPVDEPDDTVPDGEAGPAREEVLRRLREAVHGYARLPTDPEARHHIRQHGGWFLLRLRDPDEFMRVRLRWEGDASGFCAEADGYFAVQARTVPLAVPFDHRLVRTWAVTPDGEVVPLDAAPPAPEPSP